MSDCFDGVPLISDEYVGGQREESLNKNKASPE